MQRTPFAFFLHLFAVLLSAAPFAAIAEQQTLVPDTIAQRVQACVICHGKEGRATRDGYYPRIAGKPAGYLYNQLVNFRDGRRHYPVMTAMLANLSDEYLHEIAQYFADQHPPYAAPQAARASAQELARGQQLVQRGDPVAGIPACVSCHGGQMTGVTPAVPGLLGLPRDYLLGQIGGWKIGARKAHQPDCMAQIVHRMSAQDISAVATWLAAQPVPGEGLPATSHAMPLPLDCGGLDARGMP